MTAEILTFPAQGPRRPRNHIRPSVEPDWADRHFPLINAAMDLGATDDAEFRKRCSLIAQTEGRSVLARMARQLDRLATHISGVVAILSLTSRRIRNLLAEDGVT